ncbi:MAG: aconitate hydratase AcnA [Granulosicoccaceae bacterium]
MHSKCNDSFGTLNTLQVGGENYAYHDLRATALVELGEVERLPKSIKVLLENLLRHEDGLACTRDDIVALAQSAGRRRDVEIAYHPARVLMQDFTGVPAVVDLAAMRDALDKAGIESAKINPLSPVDLVIDHSVVIDQFGSSSAFTYNVEREMQRNAERYAFLKWGQGAFDNFALVPPGTGICHQVNLEFIARAVWTREVDGQQLAYPDTLVGTDSHTTMINGLGVLGWGVGGIEAEAAMLGQPISMLIPEVVGFELKGQLAEGITATDLVLRVVQMLREHGVVGKFVEFYGDALDTLPLADRATIANMAPEYGATCGFFPIDAKTIDYLRLSNRDEQTLALVESYCRAQGLWREAGEAPPQFAASLSLDLESVQPNLSGPKRPQDRVPMTQLPEAMKRFIDRAGKDLGDRGQLTPDGFEMGHGDVVIASITSCTNTSNPAVMLGAGLLAKKAVEKGLTRKPWVKTSLAPGSKVVTEYLQKSGLQPYLDLLGFNTVGYGCTTCIGNSGPLPEAVQQEVQENDLIVTSVLSGNRNFEGRIHPLVQANWLASPPLVVAFALAGSTRLNLSSEPLGQGEDGKDVYLRDLWPSNEEIAAEVAKIDREMFRTRYADVFSGDASWQAVPTDDAKTYAWQEDSTYIRLPPFFETQYTQRKDEDILGARLLLKLGDSVTTDHISPAGSIAADSPAAAYLRAHGVERTDFNSYGARRGNHEVMMRGTFANIRIRNELAPGTEGGVTRRPGQDEVLSVYDAAMAYMAEATPTVVVAGKEYGTGSSRDWAAKGTLLLGVKAVIVESFERIHRSNLVGMGVLPLQFTDGQTRDSLRLSLDDRLDIIGLGANGERMQPQQLFDARVHRADGTVDTIKLQSRIDTAVEVEYYLAGGILQYVLERLKSA